MQTKLDEQFFKIQLKWAADAFRADADVLALLERSILGASGKSAHVRLLPNGWVSSPPLIAVIDQQQTRYLFSPLPHRAGAGQRAASGPDTVAAGAGNRPHGLSDRRAEQHALHRR